MITRQEPGPLLQALTARMPSFAGDRPHALAPLLVSPERSLPVPPASDRTVWGRIEATELLAHADRDVGTPWPLPLAHDTARFHTDGDRRAWERAAFARVQRSSRSVIAAAVSRDESRLADVLDGAVLLCEQTSWCWPAHDEARDRRGWVLPDVQSPTLDLGAGEIAAHLAWLDHLLGDALEGAYPGVRSRIRTEVRSRVLVPFLERHDWWWLGDERPAINWNPWILGNVLVAALRLLDGPDDADLRSRAVARVVWGLDRYVADMPTDGAVDEGYDYWWAGAARLLEALELLSHATAGALDVRAEIPAVRETVAFPHRMHLGGRADTRGRGEPGDAWFVSVADAQARSDTRRPWGVLARAARHVGDRDAEAFAASFDETIDADESMSLGRLAQELAHRPGHERARPPLPEETWLPSTQMLIARERAGTPHGLTLVAKGGNNAESHNHNDVGSVIVASDGVPVVVDAGRPTYTAQTFGENRYALWMMQSAWHSVPMIAGHDQSAGRSFAASDVSHTADTLDLELADAYGLGNRLSWTRRARLERQTRTVTIRDRWHRGTEPGARPDCAVRFLLAGEVTLKDGRARVIPLEGAPPVEISWTTGEASLVPRPLEDAMLASVWGEGLTRLDLTLPDLDVSRVGEITVSMRQDYTEGER